MNPSTAARSDLDYALKEFTRPRRPTKAWLWVPWRRAIVFTCDIG